MLYKQLTIPDFTTTRQGRRLFILFLLTSRKVIDPFDPLWLNPLNNKHLTGVDLENSVDPRIAYIAPRIDPLIYHLVGYGGRRDRSRGRWGVDLKTTSTPDSGGLYLIEKLPSFREFVRA